jgi:hypothetical protein
MHMARKVSMPSFLKPSNQPTTVVIRTPKPRPDIVSVDKGVLEITPEVSPSTSGEANTSSGGKQSATTGRTKSTGVTSLDSKFSVGAKTLSGHSSGHTAKAKENKLLAAEETIVNNGTLTPINEVAHEVVEILPVPVPSKFCLLPLSRM